ncbi:MAG: FYVE zinc finger domain-containing protein [Candidatus Micrarchaeota archaeon]
MDALMAGVYYLYLILGSVSLGYLLLRLNYPDVRLFSQRKKLAYSLGVGAAIVVLSIAADFALSGGGAVAAAAGFAATFVFVFVLAAFLAVKAAAMAAKPDYVVVGIPRRKSPVVQKLLTIRRAVGEEKAPAAPMKAQQIGAMAQATGVMAETGTAPAIAPASSMTSAAAIERRRYNQAPSQAGGFDFGKILGGVTAPFRGILAKKHAAPAVPGAPRRDASKAAQAMRETEFQQMITDIVREKPGAQVFAPTETPGGRRRMYLGGAKTPAAQRPATEEEEMLAAVGYRQTVPGQANPDPRRRWFVEKGQPTAVTSNTDLQSFVQELYRKQQEKAEGGKPRQDDYGLLVQEIYTKTSKEEAAPAAKKEGKTEKAGTAPAEKKELTMADLFGQQPAKKAPEIEPKEGDLFRQLNAMAGGTEAKAESQAPKEDVHLMKVEASKSTGCPTCGSKSSRIVFCPYCGAGMCTNCSPMIVPMPDSFVYTCPKCGEEVSVKKKAESAA